MSDRDSNKNTDGDGDGPSSSCQNRKRELELLEIQPAPAPGAEGEDSSDDGDSDEDGGEGRRVKPKLELESDPSVNDNMETEEELEEDRKKKSAELKLKVMKNTVVMEKIAEKLSVKNLLDLRQTCPRWNQSFIPQIRKNHEKIHFKSGGVSGVDDKTRDTDEFMELIRSSQDFPFARYCFGADPPEDKDVRTHDCLNFTEFVYEFGNTITTLTASWKGQTNPPVSQLLKLRRVLFYSRLPELKELCLELGPSFLNEGNHLIHLRKTSRELTYSLPKLKRFSVTHAPAWNGSHPEFCQLVSDVIQWASGLEFLMIQDETPDNKIVQAALAGLLLRNFEQSIKTLQLPFLNVVNLKKLVELARRKKNPLQLNSFTTDVKCFCEPANEQKTEAIRHFHYFLVTQSKTLEKLSITFKYGYLDGDDDDLLYIRIPQMERVKDLKIDPGAEPLVEHKGQAELNALLGAFPALRKFSLGRCSALMDCHCTDCTKLTSHSCVEEFNVSARSDEFIGFTRFGIVFPSLTRLELKLTDYDWAGLAAETQESRYNVSEFTTIWRAWPSLTVVKLIGEFNGANLDFDSFLTGVAPVHNFARLRDEYFRLDHITLSALRGILAKYKTMPGISDLKHLREVTIDIRSARKSEPALGESTLRLTNIGGYFGVALASPQLQRVSIHGQTPNEVYEDCQAFIRKTFGPYTAIDL